jgi:hypothetical protein
MSEPVTLYRLVGTRDKELVYREKGTFVERAWCAFHKQPLTSRTIKGTDRRVCWLGVLQESFSSCVPEPLPRLVQEPPQ